MFPLIGYTFLPKLVLEYLPNIVTAVIMFCLSSGRCIRSIYQSNLQYMPITAMFLRDGVLWFLSALVGLILQSVLLQSTIVYNTPGSLVVVTYSVVSSRVLFGMRSLERKSDEMDQSRELTTLAFQSTTQLTIGWPTM